MTFTGPFVIRKGWFNRWHVYRVGRYSHIASEMNSSWQWLASCRSLCLAEKFVKAF